MQLATESIADESSRPADNADPAADPKTKADDPTKLFLVLEGGGAKGIAHVAAWKALDRLVAKPKEAVAPPPSDLGSERFVLTGVAGTSAGAVIAAFIAAGAKAEDLIDDNGEVPLCKTLNIRRFRDIFSVAEWRRLKFIRLLKSPSGRIDAQARKYIRSATQGTHAIAASPPALDDFGSPFGLNGFALILYACVFISAVLYYWIDNTVIFASRGAENAVFLVFWVITLALFSLTNFVLRKWEQRKYRSGKRHFRTWMRFFFHPLVTLGVSLAVTVRATKYLASSETLLGIYRELVNSTWSVHLFGREFSFFPFVLLLWLLCGMAVALTIIVSIRRWLKGTVNSLNLQRDINKALKSILTRTIDRLVIAGKADTTFIPLISAMSSEDYKVSFNDITRVTGISLSIITSDIIGNQVHVFSDEADGKCSVAEAVTGSISIPFAFCFVRSGNRILFDGGLISSIPAWVYRRHRTRDPDCRILAIGIEPDKYDTWIPAFFEERHKEVQSWRDRAGWRPLEGFMAMIGVTCVFFKAPIVSVFWPISVALNVASTAVFGGRSLDLEASDRLDNFSLKPRVGLLDFDMSPRQAKSEIDRLQTIARTEIENLLWRRKVAFSKVGSRIEQHLRTRGSEKVSDGRIRVFWAMQEGTTKAVRIKYTYGFDKDDVDDRLVLPFGSSMTAWAAQLECSQFGSGTTLTEMLKGRMNRYRAAAKWGRKWCWAIPMRHGDVAGVLAIEASEDVEKYDPPLGAIAAARSAAWLDASRKKLRFDERGEIIPPEKRSSDDMMAKLEEDWKTLATDLFLPTLASRRG